MLPARWLGLLYPLVFVIGASRMDMPLRWLVPLTLAALLSGLFVMSVHMRQRSWAAYGAVFVGTWSGGFLSLVAVLFTGMAILVPGGGSRRVAPDAMMLFVGALALAGMLGGPLGATLGARLARRRQPPNHRRP